MIKFTKMQGLGNDYVYIDCVTNNLCIKDTHLLAQFVSNRHFGIGSDGLILICKSNVADFKMQMFNSDGTEAEMCGNGIRCVGKFVYDKGLTKKENVSIETLAGIKYLQLHVENGKVSTVTVDMGEPVIGEKDLLLKADDKEFNVNCVSMGNPHAITQIDDLEKFNIEKYGPIIENDKHFPNKTNVEFINIIDKKHIKMRVWERGTGETLACGTGACAVSVACIQNNVVERNVDVELLGGTLQIEWNDKDNHIYMTGPAKTVFEGEIEYDKN